MQPLSFLMDSYSHTSNCSNCTLAFGRLASVKHHMRTRTNNSSCIFNCSYCTLAFGQLATLKHRMWTRTNNEISVLTVLIAEGICSTGWFETTHEDSDKHVNSTRTLCENSHKLLKILVYDTGMFFSFSFL
jgi:hypothetical protein